MGDIEEISVATYSDTNGLIYGTSSGALYQNGIYPSTEAIDITLTRVTEPAHHRISDIVFVDTNYYFITICTHHKKCLFWTNGKLNCLGQIVYDAVQQIPTHFPQNRVEQFVIMPNHIHLLVRVCADEYGRPLVAPTMSRVVKQLKGVVSKQAGISIWQKSFHDHIIRNREDYEEHLRYIYENPIRWYYDELYAKE